MLVKVTFVPAVNDFVVKVGLVVLDSRDVPVPAFEREIPLAGLELTICILEDASFKVIPVPLDRDFTLNDGAVPLTTRLVPAPAFANVEAVCVFVNVIVSVVVPIESPVPTAKLFSEKFGFVLLFIRVAPLPEVAREIPEAGEELTKVIVSPAKDDDSPVEANKLFSSKPGDVPIFTNEVPTPLVEIDVNALVEPFPMRYCVEVPVTVLMVSTKTVPAKFVWFKVGVD